MIDDWLLQAVAKLGLLPIVSNTSVTSMTEPAGCYVTSTKDGYAAPALPFLACLNWDAAEANTSTRPSLPGVTELGYY